jgi:hypothetical protein
MNAWIGFLTRYLVTAAAGTALILVLAPRPKAVQPSHASGDAAVEEPLSAAQAHAALQLADDSRHFVELADLDLPSKEDRPSPSAPVQEVRAAPASPPTTEPAASEPAASEPAVSEPAVSEPPAPNGSRWGVVSKAKTAYYSSSGSFLGHLAPGALLDVVEIKQNKSELLAFCRADDGPVNTLLIVKADHLDMYTGSLQTMNYEMKSLHAERARVKIELDTREQQRKNELRGDNPFAPAFRKARTEYADFWQKVQDLQAGRDRSLGADRSHYANELRKLKGRDITVRTNYDRAKEKYDEWNLGHPTAALPESEPDPLAEELKRIEAQIQSLAG